MRTCVRTTHGLATWMLKCSSISSSTRRWLWPLYVTEVPGRGLNQDMWNIQCKTCVIEELESTAASAINRPLDSNAVTCSRTSIVWTKRRTELRAAKGVRSLVENHNCH